MWMSHTLFIAFRPVKVSDRRSQPFPRSRNRPNNVVAELNDIDCYWMSQDTYITNFQMTYCGPVTPL